MYETRVVCGACHTGRSGRRLSGGADEAHGVPAHGHGGSVASAGNIDCIHCHGPGFDGMLARWQESVGGELERLRPLVDELEEALAEQQDHPARAPLAEARQNVQLVALDGSRGAHNPTYALAALRVGAERIDLVRELLGTPADHSATAGMPFVSKDGCSACHLGIEEVVAAAPGGGHFPHDAHVSRAELECDTCHDVIPPGLPDHGSPAPDRADCVSCHHAEDGPADPFDCASCHGAQESLLLGSLPGHADGPAPKADMDCSECHGEPPDVMLPGERLCQLCHGSGYAGMLASLQGAVGAELARLVPLLDEADVALLGRSDTAAVEDLVAARNALEALAHDGSRGVHDPPLALSALRESAERIDRARAVLGLPDVSGNRPYLPPEECASCHAGVESVEAILDSGRRFPHGTHLKRDLACADCHTVDLSEHRLGGGGAEPAAARPDCSSCHHSEDGPVDPWECSSCHSAQEHVLFGELEGFEGEPGPKADMECTDCHGEPPDLGMPNTALCRLCHDEESRAGFDAFRSSVDERLSALSAALDGALERGVDASEVERARRAHDVLRADGTLGAHNSVFVLQVLDETFGAIGSDHDPGGGDED
jgi:hypothetical protein